MSTFAASKLIEIEGRRVKSATRQTILLVCDAALYPQKIHGAHPVVYAVMATPTAFDKEFGQRVMSAVFMLSNAINVHIMATTFNNQSVKDLCLVLTDGANDTEGLTANIRKAVSNYLNLLVQIQVCIETNRVPLEQEHWGFADFDEFRYEMEELCKGLEKHKSSTLLTA